MGINESTVDAILSGSIIRHLFIEPIGYGPDAFRNGFILRLQGNLGNYS